MNEEYEVYYRNPFRRLWEMILNARSNLMRMESNEKERKLQSEMRELYETKERYESDCERAKLLKTMISDLELRIEKLSDRNSSGDMVSDDEETLRLKAVLRRRSAEFMRLQMSMKNELDSICENLSGREKTQMRSKWSVPSFAAAML